MMTDNTLTAELQRLQDARVVARYRGPHHVLAAAAAIGMPLLLVIGVLSLPAPIVVAASLVVGALLTAFVLTYVHALRRGELRLLCAWTVTVTTRGVGGAQTLRDAAVAGRSWGQPATCNCDHDCGESH